MRSEERMPADKKLKRAVFLDNKARARRMRLSGMKIGEIAGIFGRPYQTVYCWVRDIQPDMLGNEPVGPNADRHLCETCQYRGNKIVNGCDYIENVRHSRGCKIAECDQYVKGPRIKSYRKKYKGL